MRLHVGEFRIGRSPECEISLSGGTLSRRHALLRVTLDTVSIEDTNSSNGVVVNGRRIAGPTRLSARDTIVVGEHVFELLEEAVPALDPTRATSSKRLSYSSLESLVTILDQRARAAKTSTGDDSASGRSTAPMPVVVESEATEVRDALTEPMPAASPAPKRFSPRPSSLRPDPSELESSLPEAPSAEEALARGDVAAAERILIPALARLRGQVADGTRVSPALAEQGALLAATLADLTGKGAWADYPVRIYSKLRRPMPAGVIDAYERAIAKAQRLDVDGLHRYVAALRAPASPLTAAEQELARRIAEIARRLG